MKYNVAMIGTGYMARKHCAALATDPNARLVAVCSTERSRATADEFKSFYGFLSATSDYTSILTDSEIDLVFICSPDNLHTQQVCAGLAHGKHVFCEKPLARAEDDFRQIAKALETTNK